jgi:Bacterial membrane protein YfhO
VTPRAPARHECWGAAFVLGLALLVFFGEPLLRIHDSHYCFADFLQGFSLLNVEPGHLPSNKQMGDPAVAFLPWLLFDRQEIHEGRIPLWNPFNGAGVPHLANYQSAVFSLYSLPYYLLTLRFALLVSAALKLVLIGAFSYLFLRQLGRSWTASVMGAVIHTFGGYYVVWLSGTPTAAATTLPASFYFAERVASLQGASRGQPLLATVGLAASLTIGLLGGHPETFFAGAVFLAAYCIVRALSCWSNSRTSTSVPDVTDKRVTTALRGVLSCGSLYVLAAVLAIGMAAIQLVPFAEYLAHSVVFPDGRGLQGGRLALPPRLLMLLLFPEALGNSTDAYELASAAGSSFVEVASLLVPAFALLLALLSSRFAARDRDVRFFLLAACLWVVYAWNPLRLGALFALLPGLSHLTVTRSQPVFLFAVSCLAALSIDCLEARGSGGHRRLIVIGGIVFSAMGVVALRSLYLGLPPALAGQSKRLLSTAARELAWFALPSAMGVAALLARSRRQGRLARALADGTLLLVVFAQGGYRLRNFNPTIEDRFVYPRTGAMELLQSAVGRDRVVVSGSGADTLIPNANLVYGLSMPGAYDAIWIRHVDTLYRHFFGELFPRAAQRVEELGLKLFGVRYVLTDGPLPDGERVEAQRSARADPLGEILPGSPVEQTFTPRHDGLAGVAALLGSYARENRCTLLIAVEEEGTGRALGERRLPCAEVGEREWVVLRFAAERPSRGRSYRLRLRSDDARSGSALTAFADPRPAREGSELRVGGRARAGTLAFDYAPNLDAFEPLVTLQRHRLYRYRETPGRFFTVGQVASAATDEETLRMFEAGLDPAETAVITGAPAPEAAGPPAAVEVVSEEPQSITLATTRPTPGCLVTAMSSYSGWKATVNGAERPVLRVNGAFLGVALPAGRSTIVLRYKPASFTCGAWISLSSVAATTALGFWAGRARRRDRDHPGPRRQIEVTKSPSVRSS